MAYGARLVVLKAALVSAGQAGAEPVTVAALGDSLTQGFGLPPEQGFVPQLEAWLRTRGHDVSLINAGVSGDTTAGGLSRVAWTLTPDVDAMIVALGGNDLLRGLPYEMTRTNLASILEAGQTAGVELMLVGMQAPGNYGPEFKAAFDRIYPDLAAEFETVFAPSFLSPITDLPDQTTARATYVQPDGLHPNAQGVALIVEHLGPEVERLILRAAGS